MAFKMKGFSYPGKSPVKFGTTFSPTKQVKTKQDPYWYKINGKPVSKHAYNKYKNIPGQMEGGGKTTNDPDPSGRKAQTAKDRAKLPKKHTVLTEQQTKNIK